MVFLTASAKVLAWEKHSRGRTSHLRKRLQESKRCVKTFNRKRQSSNGIFRLHPLLLKLFPEWWILQGFLEETKLSTVMNKSWENCRFRSLSHCSMRNGLWSTSTQSKDQTLKLLIRSMIWCVMLANSWALKLRSLHGLRWRTKTIRKSLNTSLESTWQVARMESSDIHSSVWQFSVMKITMLPTRKFISHTQCHLKSLL